MRHWRAMLAVLAAALLLSAPPLLSWSNASGVHSVIALFESHAHPDIPFDNFAAGRLGIIKPAWNRSYLYVAYRYMAGPGFDAPEQKALTSYWNEKLGLEPSPAESSDTQDAQTRYGVASGTANKVGKASAEWISARNKVPGVAAMQEIDVYRSAAAQYAFRTAASTLATMIGRFGQASAQVRQWLDAQDQVFDNCSDTPPVFAANPDAWFAAVDAWTQASRKVPGVSTADSFSGNCKAAKFQTATAALESMIHDLGASNPKLKQWVDAQNQALVECSRQPEPPRVGPDIPVPLAHGTPFERAQRTYQSACATFYSGKFDVAAKMFEAIAADPSSPWWQLAPYLVARATIRIATLTAAKNDNAMLAQAEAQLNKIVATSGNDSVKHSARRLLGFVETQLHPEQRQQELARAVMMRTPGDVLKQDVSDYIWMLYHGPANDNAPGDDLTDWISNLHIDFFANSAAPSYDAATIAHSIDKWKKTSSITWLVAAIIEIPASDPNAPALMEAAEKVKPGSPAFATVTYHTARLLIGQGKIDQARDKLDAILATRSELPVSTVNELARLRMGLARNLSELLVDAPRTTLGFTDDGDGEEIPSKLDEPAAAAETPAPQATPARIAVVGVAKAATATSDSSSSRSPSLEPEVIPMPAAPSTPVATPDPVTETLKTLAAEPLFDNDGAGVLTRGLPLNVMMQAAQSRTLPHNLREQVARATFIRAILLGNETAARELAPAVMESVPKLKPSIDALLTAKSPEAQRFAAAFMMLQNPGLRYGVDSGPGRITALDEIDGLRDNWWGSRVGQTPQIETYPSFLSAAQKKSAAEEWQKLSAINAPNFLCTEAIEQAKSHPHDGRAPEALYQCTRAVHLGCSNDQSTEFAKSAFVLLHRRFPDSPWAAKSKVWYKGSGGCS